MHGIESLAITEIVCLKFPQFVPKQIEFWN
jgi:hypothetical protein